MFESLQDSPAAHIFKRQSVSLSYILTAIGKGYFTVVCLTCVEERTLNAAVHEADKSVGRTNLLRHLADFPCSRRKVEMCHRYLALRIILEAVSGLCARKSQSRAVQREV